MAVVSNDAEQELAFSVLAVAREWCAMRARILNRPRINTWAELMGADITATHGKRQKQLERAYAAYWDESADLNRQLEDLEMRMAAMVSTLETGKQEPST